MRIPRASAFLRRLLLLALMLPAMVDTFAQTPAAGNKPKVCLVLSGGGARGAAHIGVLKVLEQYRVPIDCIAGTSMGALVGAAYASGMSVAEMEQVIGGITVESLIKDKPPRDEMSMRRKGDDYRNFIGPEIGIRDGKFGVAKGLISGIQLETVLRQLSKIEGFQHFDALPIPFRAVATNLVTGKAVVFDQGELANVMRASMSVPIAVAPAEFDGMMLVDGMLTDNLPVDAARAMGADIVIAVNVGTPLLKREQLTGVLGIADQMINILTEQNVQRSLASLKATDILISPNLGEFSTADFDKLAQIAPLGVAAAGKLAERLAQLSLPADEYAALRQRQQVAVLPDLRPVDVIRFDELQRVNPKTALAVLKTQPGEPLDQRTLNEDMRRLYGTGDFEHVNYRLVESGSQRVLAIDAVEKAWGPDYMRFGLGLSTDSSGNAYFNIAASYRKTWLDTLGAEWRTDLQFGNTSGLFTEFYQPLNAQGSYFVAPHAAIQRNQIRLFDADRVIAQYDVSSALAGIDLGLQFEQYGVFRLGLLGGLVRPALDSGPPSLSPGESSIAQGGVSARLFLDQLDSVHFPRSGWQAKAQSYTSTPRLGADDSFTKWEADATGVFSFGEHTLNFNARAGGKIGSNPLPNYDQFLWGGFLRQSGYQTGALYGSNLTFGRAMYYHRILRGGILEGAYGGFSLEAGKVGNPLVPGNPDGWLRSGAVFLGADSPLGPIYLGYGRTVDGPGSFYFYLGRPF